MKYRGTVWLSDLVSKEIEYDAVDVDFRGALSFYDSEDLLVAAFTEWLSFERRNVRFE